MKSGLGRMLVIGAPDLLAACRKAVASVSWAAANDPDPGRRCAHKWALEALEAVIAQDDAVKAGAP